MINASGIRLIERVLAYSELRYHSDNEDDTIERVARYFADEIARERQRFNRWEFLARALPTATERVNAKLRKPLKATVYL